MASNGPPNAPRGPQNLNPPSGSLPNGLASSRYATPAPAIQAPAQFRGPQPAQRPAQARPRTNAQLGAGLVQSAGPAQTNRQASATSVQSRAPFIPPPPTAVPPITALVSDPARLISDSPQAFTISSDIESLKIRLEQAESVKKGLEKHLEERDDALTSTRKTQIDMAKMLGERKGEIDNAKWQIEDLEIAKAELERELAKKKLATISDEGHAAQVASDKKALEYMMKEKEESARRAEKEIAEARASACNAEEQAIVAESRFFEAQGHAQTLKTELSSQKKLFIQAEGEVEWLRVELKKQAEMVTQAQREVLQLKAEVEDQKNLYAVANNGASRLRRAVDELEVANRACTAQYATLEQEKEIMKAKMTELTERFNDSLHAANAAKKEIKNQKPAVAVTSIASTKSTGFLAQNQVEQTKTEEQECVQVIISRADNRVKRKISPLQRFLAGLVVFLTFIAMLQPVFTAPAVKVFFQTHSLTNNFFQEEQNQSIAKYESTCTISYQLEATPEVTPPPNEYHGSDAVDDIGTVFGNTETPTQPVPGDTAS